MKYECKENDAIIELGRDKDEVLIYIQGESAKTVIGLKDLHQALNIFGVSNSVCSCGSLNYGYGFAKCYDCGKIKDV